MHRLPEGGIGVGNRKRLLAGMLLLLLWRLLFPAAARELRERAEAVFWPAGSETVAVWGRALGEESPRVAALRRGSGP